MFLKNVKRKLKSEKKKKKRKKMNVLHKYSNTNLKNFNEIIKIIIRMFNKEINNNSHIIFQKSQ